jgi:hypothetical protein
MDDIFLLTVRASKAVYSTFSELLLGDWVACIRCYPLLDGVIDFVGNS